MSNILKAFYIVGIVGMIWTLWVLADSASNLAELKESNRVELEQALDHLNKVR